MCDCKLRKKVTRQHKNLENAHYNIYVCVTVTIDPDMSILLTTANTNYQQIIQYLSFTHGQLNHLNRLLQQRHFLINETSSGRVMFVIVGARLQSVQHLMMFHTQSLKTLHHGLCAGDNLLLRHCWS